MSPPQSKSKTLIWCLLTSHEPAMMLFFTSRLLRKPLRRKCLVSVFNPNPHLCILVAYIYLAQASKANATLPLFFLNGSNSHVATTTTATRGQFSFVSFFEFLFLGLSPSKKPVFSFSSAVRQPSTCFLQQTALNATYKIETLRCLQTLHT